MLKVVETFPYECKMGKKVIKYRGWKTKDEKAYLIITESKEDISDKDLFDTLVLPCIEDKNIYLSDAEVQNLIIEIRKKSLGESFDVKFICKNDECKAMNEIEVKFDDIVDFQEDKVQSIKIGETEFFFGSIKNGKALEDKNEGKSNVEKIFNEMVMRIEKVIIDDKIEDTFSFEEISEYIDNLDSKIFDELILYYTENISKINMFGELKCHRCGKMNKFIFDEIPNFLAGW